MSIKKCFEGYKPTGTTRRGEEAVVTKRQQYFFEDEHLQG